LEGPVLTIGLTGGIGSGKSTVAQMLVARGSAFVNADLVGHRSYRKGTATYERLIEAFGPEIVGAEGEIDRQKLGRRVFADPEDRRRLNDIVWPAMAEMMARDLDELRAKGERLAVLEAAILLEAGWQWLVDEVWVVVASPETAVSRLEAAGMGWEQVEARIRSQLSNEERIYQADVVIENDGTTAELEAKVQSLWEQLQERIVQHAS
jgi:dephospho-CoA kinase